MTDFPDSDVVTNYLHELDIDSALFDRDALLQRLLGQLGGDRLREFHERIAGEERLLNGEMKSLVYQNYEKFFKVQQVLAETRESVEATISQLESLTQKLSQVAEKCEGLEDQLKSHPTTQNS